MGCAHERGEVPGAIEETEPPEAGRTGAQVAAGAAREAAPRMDAEERPATTTGGRDRGGQRPTRAARYLQAAPGRSAKGVSWQQLERLRRLHATGAAGQLVLQFGQYRGTRLVEIADHDPDYVRSLALSAQRPQVRAAARALVLALEWTERKRPTRRSAKAAQSAGAGTGHGSA
ncbi:MAG: hypothetical protein JO023_19690 [Chloroflexi bacterium]|nr:hypothetical protein [Chloroflexota bacterium]